MLVSIAANERRLNEWSGQAQPPFTILCLVLILRLAFDELFMRGHGMHDKTAFLLGYQLILQ